MPHTRWTFSRIFFSCVLDCERIHWRAVVVAVYIVIALDFILQLDDCVKYIRVSLHHGACTAQPHQRIDVQMCGSNGLGNKMRVRRYERTNDGKKYGIASSTLDTIHGNRTHIELKRCSVCNVCAFWAVRGDKNVCVVYVAMYERIWCRAGAGWNDASSQQQQRQQRVHRRVLECSLFMLYVKIDKRTWFVLEYQVWTPSPKERGKIVRQIRNEIEEMLGKILRAKWGFFSNFAGIR